MSSFAGHSFIWKEITRKEFEYIVSNTNHEWELEEMLCSTAVVFPENFDFINCKAGITATLGLHIIEISGFGDISHSRAYLEHSQNKMQTFESQAEVIIKTAFPDITFNEMKNWTVRELMDYLAKAEWKLNNFNSISFALEVPDSIEEKKLTPEEVEKAKKEMIKQGVDPMIALAEYIMKPGKEFQMPTNKFIGGQDWRRVKE